MVEDARTVPPVAPWPGLQTLRDRGADRFDPLAYSVIEALARRAAARGGGTSPGLERSLAQAADRLLTRLAGAEPAAGTALADGLVRHPDAADALRQNWENRDFPALARRLAVLDARGHRPLGALLTALTQGQDAVTAGELRAVRQYSHGWSRLRVDRQLTAAFAQAPANAGPLNSHRLVLQALDCLRDIAPDYLDGLLIHAESLLWLEQAQGGAAAKSAPAGAGKRRPRSGGRSGKTR